MAHVAVGHSALGRPNTSDVTVALAPISLVLIRPTRREKRLRIAWPARQIVVRPSIDAKQSHFVIRQRLISDLENV